MNSFVIATFINQLKNPRAARRIFRLFSTRNILSGKSLPHTHSLSLSLPVSAQGLSEQEPKKWLLLFKLFCRMRFSPAFYSSLEIETSRWLLAEKTWNFTANFSKKFTSLEAKNQNANLLQESLCNLSYLCIFGTRVRGYNSFCIRAFIFSSHFIKRVEKCVKKLLSIDTRVE